MLLAPTVNLHRTPFGGRHFECFSEDPLLTARIGVAYVRGLQNSGVGATVKHFVGNDSETERMTVDVRIDERTLRELYLAPFEAIVREAGAWAVMASYNGVNGSTMTESPLLRGILHDEWGYDGLVMSDWTAARSTEPAARAALDLAMPGPASRFGPWGDALVAGGPGGPGRRGAHRRQGAPHPAPGRPGRRARRCVPVSPAPVDIPRELRAAAAASFVLARNERSCRPHWSRWTSRPSSALRPPRTRLADLTKPSLFSPSTAPGWAASPSSARTPRSRARSAAAAPPSSRPTRSPRSTACAPPGSTWRSRREPSGT